MILSGYEIRGILDNKKIEFIADVNLWTGKAKVRKESDKVIINSYVFSLEKLKKCAKKLEDCYIVKNNDIEKIGFFSQETGKYYKLVAIKKTAPTFEISGIRMHVSKLLTPWEDAEKKISFIKVRGTTLDTCTGLGYSAIIASRNSFVYTFEIDENVIYLEKINPYSKELFNNEKIKLVHGDIKEKIKDFPAEFFDCIIHDPPRFSLDPELYSLNFYKQLYRVLKLGGMVYHYTGMPGSKKRNIDLRRNVMKRLSICGFINIRRVFNGVVCEK